MSDKIDDYAKQKATDVANQIYEVCNPRNDKEGVVKFIIYSLEQTYKQGTADQKRGAVAALRKTGGRISLGRVSIDRDYATQVVMESSPISASHPESDRGEMEVG